MADILTDDIIERILLNENIWISISISLNFAPKGQINNIPSLFKIMAWRRIGDKPLSELMLTRFMTHIWGDELTFCVKSGEDSTYHHKNI